MHRAWMGLAAGALTLAACFWTSPRAYQTELDRLERERNQSEEQARLAQTEAQRYAAVVYFADGSAEIDAAGARELAWFAERMKPYPQAVIEVQGFADSGGDDAGSQKLSDARAQAVARFLAAEGIDATRLVAGGLSTRFSAAGDETPKGRRNNRRVEVIVH